VSGLRLGVDIGGTFTDAILWDEEARVARIAKVPSTPDDPSRGFLRVVETILCQDGTSPAEVGMLVHGTTVATNAIIEGKIARTAFVTTDGFRDLLEIGRQNRPSLYDLQFVKPRPLVTRDLCFQIAERLDAVGQVVLPLDEQEAEQIGRELARAKVESVAVCLLHSYVNAVHEQRLGAILRRHLPQASISLSSDVAPEFREYLRASTTVVNAGVRPIVKRYLSGIRHGLDAYGLEADMLVMQSNGGLMTTESAAERPVFMVESGPAAGVMAATHLGRTINISNLISFDMGGTTAKVGLVLEGRPTVTKDYEVGAKASATGSARGSGYPIRTPVIDLVEIGAGGGSIAWVDTGGALRVGPQSAGAHPGPACYGLGGTLPTVTDANVVLGRLNPDNFLGGDMRLDRERAWQAIESHCAKPLGLDTTTAANGIVEIANAAMANALHLISIQRGHDPRDFALVAFGGAGPMHANRLAAEGQIPLTVIPPSPGITSSLGLLATDLTHEFSRTVRRKTLDLDLAMARTAFAEIEAEGRNMLAREGADAAHAVVRRYFEMRYVGQSHELTIELPAGELTADAMITLIADFQREHERAYGFAAPGEPTEVVNFRATVLVPMPRPSLARIRTPEKGTPISSTRRVYFAELDGFVSAAIFRREQLPIDAVIRGPAVVEEFDSTTLIHPGYAATVDGYGNLLIRPEVRP
jgi:N-methylhydantoinase A